MPTVIVTGSGGLIGSEAVTHFADAGYDVIGVENDMRARFFGEDASTRPVSARLAERYGHAFRTVEMDVRDADGLMRLFANEGPRLALVVHAAAQPSHDWAATDPQADFSVNAQGTLNLLEALRRHAPDTPLAFC